MGMAKDGAALNGDAVITGDCGFINGVAAKDGGHAYVTEGVGSAVYRCDSKTEKCCEGARWFTATLGAFEAQAALSLRSDLTTGVEMPGLITPDPGAVYFVGTLAEGGCLQAAFATLASPQAPNVGFRCNANRYKILPSGAMIYEDLGLIYQFKADNWEKDSKGCPAYPPDPTANDPVLGTCTEAIFSILTTPDSDEVYYLCGNSWKSVLGAPTDWLRSGEKPVAIGKNGLTLFTSVTGAELKVRDAAGTFTSVTPSIAAATYMRSHDDGFYVLADRSLWAISAKGVATKVGDYGDPPAGYQAGPSMLDGAGNAFGIGYREKDRLDVVVRYAVGATGTVEYSEENILPVDPCSGQFWTKIQLSPVTTNSFLVTGP